MSIRKTPIINGEYYHFYNRGNGKQTIFIDDRDYDRFVKLLFLCNSTQSINFKTDIVEKGIDAWEFDRKDLITNICAWVIMPNHFHIYLHAQPTDRYENGAISFMQKLGTAYAKYFNTRYNRTGSLFEGKFKSVHVTNDDQARYLFSYIHLNPLKLIQSGWKEQGVKDKKKAFEYVSNYKYSSLKDWLDFNRKESSLISKTSLSNLLPTNFSPSDDIFKWLKYGSNSLEPTSNSKTLPEARLREELS